MNPAPRHVILDILPGRPSFYTTEGQEKPPVDSTSSMIYDLLINMRLRKHPSNTTTEKPDEFFNRLQGDPEPLGAKCRLTAGFPTRRRRVPNVV